VGRAGTFRRPAAEGRAPTEDIGDDRSSSSRTASRSSSSSPSSTRRRGAWGTYSTICAARSRPRARSGLAQLQRRLRGRPGRRKRPRACAGRSPAPLLVRRAVLADDRAHGQRREGIGGGAAPLCAGRRRVAKSSGPRRSIQVVHHRVRSRASLFAGGFGRSCAASSAASRRGCAIAGRARDGCEGASSSPVQDGARLLGEGRAGTALAGRVGRAKSGSGAARPAPSS